MQQTQNKTEAKKVLKAKARDEFILKRMIEADFNNSKIKTDVSALPVKP